MTEHPALTREESVYRAALQLIAQGANPAAMKVQDIARAAGIGKGTVYEYFDSKEEILRGMALYCFDDEIIRLQGLLAGCETLDDLEEAVVAYLQDLAGNRMGTYRLIAVSLGGLGPPCAPAEQLQALWKLAEETIGRLQRNGEVEPGLSIVYCGEALLSVAMGGVMRFCVAADRQEPTLTQPDNVRLLLRRALRPEGKE